MRTRLLVAGLLVGSIGAIAPMPAAAGGFYGFSVGIPLPFPVITVTPAPVYVPAPVYAPAPCPPYAVYPAPPVYYGPPPFRPRYGYGPAYGPPYGYAWGHHRHRW